MRWSIKVFPGVWAHGGGKRRRRRRASAERLEPVERRRLRAQMMRAHVYGGDWDGLWSAATRADRRWWEQSGRASSERLRAAYLEGKEIAWQ